MFPRRASASRTLTTYLAIALAFLLFGLLLLIQPPAHAQDQPEALGTLSGVASNEQGDLLPNITVWLENYISPSDRRSVTTNAQGEYHFVSVRSAGYKVRFEDTTGQYAQRYYIDALFADEAETVVVNGNTISDIDIELEVGGSISVTIQASTPLTATTISAYLYRQNSSLRWALYRSAFWNLESGNTSFIGLPAGTYRLCADVQTFIGIDEGYECYDNVLPEAEGQIPPNATDIVVQAGNATPISIAFGNAIQMQGIVRDLNGAPLSNITVMARNSEPIDPYSYPYAYPYYYFTTTDENGYFRFTYMRSATYALLFNQYGYVNDYLPSWYPNVYNWNDATFLEVTPDSRYNLEMTLAPQARITGKITLPGDVPITNPNVALYKQASDGKWQPYLNCLEPYYCYPGQPLEWNSTTGVYTATRIVPGQYRVQAYSAFNYGGPTANAFYGGATVEEADDVVVATGQTITNINIILGEDHFNSGVAGVITVDDMPQSGIEVGLFDQFNTYEPRMPMVYTSTDAQGRYLFEGLPGGAYQIAARDPAGKYATVFYDDPFEFYYGHVIFVPVTGTLESIDIKLTPGGSISGRIHVAEGQSPADYKIALIDSLNYAPLSYVDVRTDKDGFYKVTGLRPGNYLIYARAPEFDPLLGTRPIRFHPATNDQYKAIWVQVEADKERTDINISFSQTPTFLPRIGSNRAGN